MKKERKFEAIAFPEDEIAALCRLLEIEINKLEYYRIYNEHKVLCGCLARLRKAYYAIMKEYEDEETLRRFREERGIE